MEDLLEVIEKLKKEDQYLIIQKQKIIEKKQKIVEKTNILKMATSSTDDEAKIIEK